MPTRDDLTLLERLERYHSSLPPLHRRSTEGPLDSAAWEAFLIAVELQSAADPRLPAAWSGALLATDHLRPPDDRHDDCGPPLEATDARPGTPEKVAEMALRAEWGEELFHPGDAPMDDPNTVRMPVLNMGNHKLELWQIVRERGRAA